MIPSAEYSIPSNWALKILYMDPRLNPCLHLGISNIVSWKGSYAATN